VTDHETTLPGGRTGGAVRVGETVRRPVGPWTPAVHALLAHLSAAGVPHLPRVLGVDERGRETLSYLPGTVPGVDDDAVLGAAQLTSLGAWMRQQHDAVADFTHPGPWRFFGAEDVATIVAHNDLGPSNLCFAGDDLVGVFDWDLAGLSTPLLDLAQVAWAHFDTSDETACAAGLLALSTGYGGDVVRLAHDILDTLPQRMTIAAEGIPAAVRRGDEGMRALFEAGEHRVIAAARDDVVVRLARLHAAIDRG
jgi:Phosphotransferase enzyme family